MTNKLFLNFAILMTGIAASLPAQTAPKSHLQFTVIMSRHSVRTPTTIPDTLRDYAPEPWPIFNAVMGFTTPRGAYLTQLLGNYYREYLVQNGLLSPTGCASRDKFYFWADNVSRDVDTAWNLGRAMMPECDITVHKVADGKPDPLFSPFLAPQAPGIGKSDPKVASEAFISALGGAPDAIVRNYSHDLNVINRILGPSASSAAKPLTKMQILSLPENATATSPMLAAAHAVADGLVMEYTDGMVGKNLGWGRLDPATLLEVRKAHGHYLSALLNLYNSKSYASNLLSAILRSLEQAEKGAAVAGSVGNPGDKALVLVGHDYDIVRIGRMLNMKWEIEPGLPQDVPPGCALIFELWRDAANKPTIRVYFQSQTYDQLRREVPLSLKVPPARAALTVSGCAGTDCEWDRFRSSVNAAIDPAFVATPTPSAR